MMRAYLLTIRKNNISLGEVSRLCKLRNFVCISLITTQPEDARQETAFGMFRLEGIVFWVSSNINGGP